MQYNAIHAMPMQCHVLLCSGRLIIIQDLTILDMVCSLILFIICGVYRWEKVYRYIYIYIYSSMFSVCFFLTDLCMVGGSEISSRAPHTEATTVVA